MTTIASVMMEETTFEPVEPREGTDDIESTTLDPEFYMLEDTTITADSS